ncbi:hypothetical protein E5K00_06995 [Hymenobacter aquaticus]|uniref:HTTM-like domain-containing protein n=1 Tax=Hymenobacter aquaticus TaxID=1867101 RepID=A0A4Z0Q6A0_9BACT|nr:HTTM domain-containing protein [Hymenobacter aquaticus]TGE24939.1 hypothetical protein E5K00_06995 [Hymenobacter aquaticus]
MNTVSSNLATAEGGALRKARTLGLSIFRVILGVLVLKNCIFYFPMADALFGRNAIYDYGLYLTDMNSSLLRYLIYPFYAPYAPQAFLLLMMATASLFILAIGGRGVGLLLYVLILILKARNELILDGSDNVIQVTMPFLLLANSYEYFRYAERSGAAPGKWAALLSKWYQPIAEMAVYGLLIQVCYVYFFTGLEKAQGKLWQNGTATYYTMRVEEFRATDWNVPLTANYFFVVLSTYFTLFWEQAFAFLVWFRKTKYAILLCGVMLHVGIWLFMRIDNFSWIMLGTYFVFITNGEYQSMLSLARRGLGKVANRLPLPGRLQQRLTAWHS